MNPRINYTLVGSFVVILVLSALGLASWMMHERRSSDRLPYTTYFYDSVSGLNERAQVKYRGVPIGYVDQITLVNDPNERVKLRLMLDADAPIRTDTFSTLQHQGVTGLLFVELQSSNARGTRLITSHDNPAEIPSRASRLVQFTDSLDELSDKVGSLLVSFNRVSDHLEMMTNPEMRQQILDLMQSSQNLAVTAEQRLQEINPKTYEQLAEALESLTYELTLRARELPDQLSNLELSLSQQLQALQKQLQVLTEDTSSSARQLGPTLQQAERLLEQLRQESGGWLRGNQIQPRGPGE